MVSTQFLYRPTFVLSKTINKNINNKNKKMKSHSLKTKGIFQSALVLLALIAIATMVFAFTSEEKNPATENTAALAMPVEVSTPVYETITEWDEYTGRFEASNRVEVRARVSGFLESVNFVDGQMVEKGEVLFTLDDRPYKIALDQASADYRQARASLITARDNFARVELLHESGAVSREEYDQRKQALEFAKASLRLSQAKVDDAKLNLEFTKVVAPISGLVSRNNVDPGNLIDGGSPNSTLLTTIVDTSPIHFYFTSSESDYLRYVRLARKGERRAVRSSDIPVFIKLQDEEDFVHEGIINFVDNEIDMNTGTIEHRAILANHNHLLEPGMFGKVKLQGSAEYEAIMIPDDIIGTNQSLRYVYVLGEDNIVTVRNVSLGPLHSNGLRIVRDGLSQKDKLIINNIQKIRPGIAVAPTETSLEGYKSGELALAKEQ